ncbi:MAG: VOC family protein [Polyangiaceae bacterium]|jgi:predicted enzyme related to lactoylglutathione lyase
MANPNSGRFCWHELVTSGLAAATKFYGELLGWTFRDNSSSVGGTYRMFSLGDTRVGGAMAAPAGVPSGWLVYVAVDDTDSATRRVAELGGKIMVPATTVPDMLRFACASDPQGAAFGILQPLGAGAQEPPYEGPARPGTFCWDELHTQDMPAARKFYGALFGWTGVGKADGSEAYWHWKHADKEIGGMTSQIGQPNVPPHWLAYVAVSDVEALTNNVASLGGKVLMPATEIPKVGRLSVVQDPTGAVFSPFRSARV